MSWLAPKSRLGRGKPYIRKKGAKSERIDFGWGINGKEVSNRFRGEHRVGGERRGIARWPGKREKQERGAMKGLLEERKKRRVCSGEALPRSRTR